MSFFSKCCVQERSLQTPLPEVVLQSKTKIDWKGKFSMATELESRHVKHHEILQDSEDSACDIKKTT